MGGGGVAWGVVMTTPRTISPEEQSRFTRHLQYFRDVGPSYMVTKPTSGLCELDIGISEGFLRKLEFGWGEACFGDGDDIASRTPRTTSPHPSAHTTRYFKRKPSYPEVWALGVLASPHAQLASLFLMLVRCCASGQR